ncbi:MAG: purine-binding chemotaxis protein CheW [Planctomycetia bacterium]|nr:purine-binding chemotaxis protein CheW [Planctomycetia bacterium]
MKDSAPVKAPVEECWRRIGVAGDRSCPELATFIHCRNCPVLAEAARTFFDREPPQGYLEAWSRIIEEPETPPDPDAASVLVFRLGREWLALPTSALVEITTLRPLHRMPHRAAGVLEGLVNIRGQLQLCASLPALLGLDPAAPGLAAEPAPAARLLVLERPEGAARGRWVFRVDEVAGVHRVARATLRAVPSTVSQSGGHYSQALFDWQDRSVGLLDAARLCDGLDEAVAR